MSSRSSRSHTQVRRSCDALHPSVCVCVCSVLSVDQECVLEKLQESHTGETLM